MTDDGLDTQRYGPKRFRWTYQSPGGAFYEGPAFYRTRAAALSAGRAWLDARRGRAS
jgi:hypothetical protein